MPSRDDLCAQNTPPAFSSLPEDSHGQLGVSALEVVAGGNPPVTVFLFTACPASGLCAGCELKTGSRWAPESQDRRDITSFTLTPGAAPTCLLFGRPTLSHFLGTMPG